MDWLERNRVALSIAIIAIAVIGAAVWWERRGAEPALLIVPTPPAATSQARRVTVDVSGAVNQPGLYTLQEGARVADAIEAAGGATADADLGTLNRAARVRDEQKIRVPYLANIQPSGSSGHTDVQAANALIDINAASAAQLEVLPGIGTVIAQRIVSYRDEHGPFGRIEELRDSKLVGNATYERIKELVVAR